MSRAYYWYRPHPYFSNFYPGRILNLVTSQVALNKYFPDSNILSLVNRLFPNGLSPHGYASLFNRSFTDDGLYELLIEAIFELVRQASFPDSLSRLASLYASSSLDTAIKWKSLWHNDFHHDQLQNSSSLWEIEFDKFFGPYDARLLDVGLDTEFSYPLYVNAAHRYWNCESTSNPLHEILVPFPVTIIREIDIASHSVSRYSHPE